MQLRTFNGSRRWIRNFCDNRCRTALFIFAESYKMRRIREKNARMCGTKGFSKNCYFTSKSELFFSFSLDIASFQIKHLKLVKRNLIRYCYLLSWHNIFRPRQEVKRVFFKRSEPETHKIAFTPYAQNINCQHYNYEKKLHVRIISLA